MLEVLLLKGLVSALKFYYIEAHYIGAVRSRESGLWLDMTCHVETWDNFKRQMGFQRGEWKCSVFQYGMMYASA